MRVRSIFVQRRHVRKNFAFSTKAHVGIKTDDANNPAESPASVDSPRTCGTGFTQQISQPRTNNGPDEVNSEFDNRADYGGMDSSEYSGPHFL